MRSAILFLDELSQFDFGMDHPFKPVRASKTIELCERYNLLNSTDNLMLSPGPASRDDLLLFHTPEYLQALEMVDRGHFEPDMLAFGLGTQDNPLLPDLLKWCTGTVGGTLAALRMLGEGYQRTFHLLGGWHHAWPAQAEGFCYVNDICIAIRRAMEIGIDRIAYVDIDAHHGNGVQGAFYEEDQVLVVSLHETGRTLYPWSGFETEIGEGRGKGFNINVPLEPGTDDEVYEMAFDRVVAPALEAFQPKLIIAQIGADTLISDPLTHLRLTNNSYRSVVRKLANASPLFLALGGGGYDVFRTSRCWTLAWCEISGAEPQDAYAGLVGGMMFGPEAEMGSLYDRPVLSTGEVKDTARREADRVCRYIEENVFPLWANW